jgi:hypothetical protein
MMLVRIAIGVGLLTLGYFVGREVGRTESLREELERRRTKAGADRVDAGYGVAPPYTDPSAAT